jgi:hypothetical protein
MIYGSWKADGEEAVLDGQIEVLQELNRNRKKTT